jgi:hypothetical protein
MIPPSLPHKQFVRFARNKASRCGGLRTNHRHFRVWRKLKKTNLDEAYAILVPPVCMRRTGDVWPTRKQPTTHRDRSQDRGRLSIFHATLLGELR